jgi:SAM-dependent methyltransferase
MRQLLKSVIPDKVLKLYRALEAKKEICMHKGDNVECPVCNSTFSSFASFGNLKRSNARCYKCGALERHRLLYKYLTSKTDLFEKSKRIKLLHFAPEKAFYTIFSQQPTFDYYPCDLSPEYYMYDSKSKVKKVDITQIPFEDNSFDVILCNHVLEHVLNDRQAMGELYRVMKKGGWGIFQVPIDQNRENTYEDFSITTKEERLKAFGQADHVRWYGLDFKDILSSVGFNVIEDEFIKTFTNTERFRFGFMENELIYLCKK